MREFLLGVLGAGLTYAAVWYQMTPAADVVPAATVSGRQLARVAARKAPPTVAPARKHQPSTHVPIEGGSGGGALGQGQREPHELEWEGTDALVEPFPKALPKTIERMAELQRISADPKELAARVQAMETDEAELAELKAFAERFVELPPDRVQRHVPGPGHSSRASRQQR